MVEIEPGAAVECSDYPLGAVERVDGNADDGALLVRPARADYLLRIPRDLIAEATPGRVKLKVSLQDVEQYALPDEPGSRSGRAVETRPAQPGSRDDAVLPTIPGQPPTSPATG